MLFKNDAGRWILKSSPITTPEPPRRANAAPLDASTDDSEPEPHVLLPLTAAETALFARLLTAEQVFADPHERARYKTAALENHDPAQHTYAFELRHQPGMVVGRHFHYLAVTIARSGTFLTGTTEPPGPTAAFGPNGASSVLLQKTPDKAYDVRVSEGILLIEGVAAPQINFAKLADELMKRYAAAKTTSLQ